MADCEQGAIRAVTLDFWGTLLVDGPGADERYSRQRLVGLQAVLTAMGVPVTRADLTRAYWEIGRRLASRWRALKDFPVDHIVHTMLRSLDPGLPDRLGPEAMRQLVLAYATPPLAVPPTFDAGAPEALRTLRERGVTLGLVSNIMRTPGSVLRRILEQRGLLEHFSALSFSDECGIRKPDPAIFRLTLERLGVSPGEAVHVGDDPDLDVAGAKTAGLRVIQVSPDGCAARNPAPDAVIAGLRELPGALGRLAGAADHRPAALAAEPL